jgi:NAD-dependent histone deacetylase SIR2
MGTSLKVHGLKIMVKEFAKAVHTRGGKVVFVNRTKPPESTWGDVIDYWVEWDCDAWVLDLKERRTDIWLPQGAIKEDDKRKESLGEFKASSRKQSRPQATRDDKLNGVFVTFKILDTLAKIADSDGRPAARFPYWQTTTRISNASAVQIEQPKKAQPAKKVSKPLRAPRSAPPKASTSSKSKSNKRKSYPECLDDDTNNVAYQVTKLWENLRKIAPGLGQPPQEIRYPFLELSNRPDYLTPFAFDADSNHLPNVGGGTSAGWPLKHMNLVTHPPSGPPIPVHTPTVERRAVNHTYGTRASRRFSTTETIVVDGGRTSLSSQTSDTIVVATTEEEEGEKEVTLPSNLPTPPESHDPMTPSTQRIKRMGSIGAILSSEDGSEEWHDAPEVIE